MIRCGAEGGREKGEGVRVQSAIGIITEGKKVMSEWVSLGPGEGSGETQLKRKLYLAAAAGSARLS